MKRFVREDEWFPCFELLDEDVTYGATHAVEITPEFEEHYKSVMAEFEAVQEHLKDLYWANRGR